MRALGWSLAFLAGCTGVPVYQPPGGDDTDTAAPEDTEDTSVPDDTNDPEETEDPEDTEDTPDDTEDTPDDTGDDTGDPEDTAAFITVSDSSSPGTAIADGVGFDPGASTFATIDLSAGNCLIETLEVIANVGFTSSSFDPDLDVSDYDLYIYSPSGNYDYFGGFYSWTVTGGNTCYSNGLGCVAAASYYDDYYFWGEAADGVWELEALDYYEGYAVDGVLVDWSLEVVCQ